MGLVALAGAGRLRSTRDILRQTLADWSASGKIVRADIACLATNDGLTDQQVADELACVIRPVTGTAPTGAILSIPPDFSIGSDDDTIALLRSALRLDSDPSWSDWSDWIDASRDQQPDTPPSAAATAAARAAFNTWLNARGTNGTAGGAQSGFGPGGYAGGGGAGGGGRACGGLAVAARVRPELCGRAPQSPCL